MPNPALTDEFNGTSLDQSKWRPSHAWYVGRPPSKYVREDVGIYGGFLNISASVLPDDQRTARIWMGTGCVSSLQPIAGPGYYEARIKASPSPLASAFFLQIKSGQEIDIAENYGGSRTTPSLSMQARSHTHWFPKGYARQNDTDGIHLMSSPNTSWHIYGVWIKSPTLAAFYVDDRLVGTQRMKGPFTQPMYLFFLQEPSPDQGIPSPEDLKDKARFTMQIDWVRAYTLD